MSNIVTQLNSVQGVLTLHANGKKFTVQIGNDKKFSHELSKALRNGTNPAEALLFLAELGAKIDIRNDTNLKSRDRFKWLEFFGSVVHF